MLQEPVIVIGGGIAGLTTAALLANQGVEVTLFEAHSQLGGCAGTFSRGPFVFDAGATQVAGFEIGGSHQRVFQHLGIPLPKAHLLDPACSVDLADGLDPINLWHHRGRWKEERKKHFPGTESFWGLLEDLHSANWDFANRGPILPFRNTWDFIQFSKAIRPSTLFSGLFSKCSVADLLRFCGVNQDLRLRHFLDLQLKLYSQEPVDRTAALYGATVLQMAQDPLGLWHLNGSMQVLSDQLSNSIRRDGGGIFCQHRVISLDVEPTKNLVNVSVQDSVGKVRKYSALDVVCSLPPQCLIDLLEPGNSHVDSYVDYLKKLPVPSGAIVFYSSIKRDFLPAECPNHIQLSLDDPGDLFVSISSEGDGRAPSGYATVIASVFTDIFEWCDLSDAAYKNKKKRSQLSIRCALENLLKISSNDWHHNELSTPKSFAKWTGRPNGIVGGIGQHPDFFGPFGLASRTPIPGLWLCGDSIYPGEGTAGVTQSALMACRQLLSKRGISLNI